MFVLQMAAAPKTGIEFRQGSIGTTRNSLATSRDVPDFRPIRGREIVSDRQNEYAIEMRQIRGSIVIFNILSGPALRAGACKNIRPPRLPPSPELYKYYYSGSSKSYRLAKCWRTRQG